MKPFLLSLAGVAVALIACGWIDYGETVSRKEPAYGKTFEGFAIRLQSKRIDFAQDEPEPFRIDIRNENTRTSLMPPPHDPERRYALYLIAADSGETSFFTGELLAGLPENPVAGKALTPGAETTLAVVDFRALRFTRVEEFVDGMPSFPEGQLGTPSAEMVPKVLTLRAVLYSYLPGKRPDFAVASDTWPIILRAKPANRMTEEEKARKMEAWLARMRTGAYGGVGVSSQLAALGDYAVDPLIEMAEKTGDETVRESRLWAIITLCGTGSPRAEAYILKRLTDPVDLGDLAFLMWHSQGFGSEAVTAKLRALAEDIAAGRPLPWEQRRGPASRAAGPGCLEFIAKHFISTGASLSDAAIESGVARMTDEKVLTFLVNAWKPASGQRAVAVLKPLFLRPRTHPNLRKAVMRVLAEACEGEDFPEYRTLESAEAVDALWLRCGMWMSRTGSFSDADMTAFLRGFVLTVRGDNDRVKEALVLLLRKFGKASGFPQGTARPVFPEDWTAAWRWALGAGPLDDAAAVAFLCGMMRTSEPPPDSVKAAILAELKPRLGPGFPLADVARIDPETDWPACGQWLVDKGYFGTEGE